MAACRPSGLGAADLVLRAGLAAVVALAVSRGRRWSWLVTAAMATAFAGGWFQVLAALGLLGAFGAGFMAHRWRLLGAIVGALSVQGLLRLPTDGPLALLDFHGGSALVAAAAMAPVLVSGYRHSRSPTRRVTRYLVLVGALGVVAVGVLFAAGSMAARGHVERAITSSRQALQAARGGQAGRAETLLDDADEEFSSAHRYVGTWWVAPARAVPVLGYQARALDRLTAEGSRLAAQNRDTIRTADYHDLRYRSGAFNLALVDRVRQPLRRSTAALQRARDTADRMDSPWLVSPFQSRIHQYRADLVDALDDAQLAGNATEVLPGLLGGDGTRRYLVLFTTPAEERGLGGFVGDYAELTATGGKVRMTRSGPVDDLLTGAAPGTRTLLGPTDYLNRYGRYQIPDHFQDITISPDFPSVASVAAQLYPQSGGTPVDGVLAVDPYGLQALLTFTGPVHVDGLAEPLTKDNAAQVLLKDQYLRFGRDDERSDFLRQATRNTFEKLTSGDLPAPESIANTMSAQARGGHFLMWSSRRDEEQFFTRLHADGTFPRPDGGDLLAVRAQNSGHNKIDIYLHRTVAYQARVDPRTGQVEATATVTFTNDAPAGGLPNYVIGNTVNAPTGSNRINLSVYSALQAEQVSIDGTPVAAASEVELGWRVYSMPLLLGPGQTRTIVLRLSGTVAAPYHLTLSPQPAVNPESDTVSIDAGGLGHARLGPGLLTEDRRISLDR